MFMAIGVSRIILQVKFISFKWVLRVHLLNNLYTKLMTIYFIRSLQVSLVIDLILFIILTAVLSRVFCVSSKLYTKRPEADLTWSCLGAFNI